MASNVVDLERDAFDLDFPLFQCCVAEDIIDNSPKLVGYTLFTRAYGSMTGRRLIMRDLFVSEAYRGSGLGKILLKKVLQVRNLFLISLQYDCVTQLIEITVCFQRGTEMGCFDVEFICRGSNPSMSFYKKIGAVDLTDEKSYRLYKLTPDGIHALLDYVA